MWLVYLRLFVDPLSQDVTGHFNSPDSPMGMHINMNIEYYWAWSLTPWNTILLSLECDSMEYYIWAWSLTPWNIIELGDARTEGLSNG